MPGDITVLLALHPRHFVLRGARQRLIPAVKHPQNPVLGPRPGQWDGTRCKVYGTVIYDAQHNLFRMWYSGGTDTPDAMRLNEGSPRHVGYAESHDGVRWIRPSLGITEYNGSRDNNLLVRDAQAPNVFHFPDANDLNKRYLMMTETGLRTEHNKVLYSCDGVHWRTDGREPIASASHRDRVHEPFSILYDPLDPDPTKRWKGYSLLHITRHGYRGRAVGYFAGSDPEHWVEHPYQPILSADDGLESEIHLPHVTRFDDTYIMLYDAMEPNHHTQTEVAVSDDGEHFTRVQNGVKVVPNGEPGSYDAGKVCVSPRSLFVHEGRLWWYYTASPDTYQTGPRNLLATPWHRYTALAQWREDGMACIEREDGSVPCVVESCTLKATKDNALMIRLNAQTADDDAITVQVVCGDEVVGTGKSWRGDARHGEVVWNTPVVLKPGRTFTLRLQWRDEGTRLYAMRIGPAERDSTMTESEPAYHPASHPRVVWSADLHGKISGGAAVAGGHVYVGTWDGGLYGLHADNGREAWKQETNNAIVGAACACEDVVYVGSHDSFLYAFGASDGNLRWKRALSDQQHTPTSNGPWIETTPVSAPWRPKRPEETAAPMWLYLGSHDRGMHAVDPADGTIMWRYPTFNWILGQAAVRHYTVCFGSMDGGIYALDARCGALKWRYEVGRRVRYHSAVVPGSVRIQPVSASPLIVDDTLYCGADDGYVYALDLATGAERWVYQTAQRIWSRPWMGSGVLVVASADRVVYGLDPTTGKMLWKRELPNIVFGNVNGAGDRAYVACTDHHLYTLDLHQGIIIDRFDAGAPMRSDPALSPEGRLFLATIAGRVICLE